MGYVRDAFAEEIKELSLERVRTAVRNKRWQFIVVRHIHDEASMRIRSHMESASTQIVAHRGRTSKIQNNVVTVHCDSGGVGVFVPLELQPLAKKDAATLSTALLSVLDIVMASAPLNQGDRFVHVLVGDGIYTNEAAARTVLRSAWRYATPTPPFPRRGTGYRFVRDQLRSSAPF